MKAVGGAGARLAEILGLLDPLEIPQAELEAFAAAQEDLEPTELFEASEAELEALERDGAKPKPRVKKTRKRDTGKGQPRDELGRFTKVKARKKGKACSTS